LQNHRKQKAQHPLYQRSFMIESTVTN
jgi:hypothetical protein